MEFAELVALATGTRSLTPTLPVHAQKDVETRSRGQRSVRLPPARCFPSVVSNSTDIVNDVSLTLKGQVCAPTPYERFRAKELLDGRRDDNLTSLTSTTTEDLHRRTERHRLASEKFDGISRKPLWRRTEGSENETKIGDDAARYGVGAHAELNPVPPRPIRFVPADISKH